MMATASSTVVGDVQQLEVLLVDLAVGEHDVPDPRRAARPSTRVPSSTIGNDVTLRVCTSVIASKISSNVPKPPGSAMKPCAYLTNIVLRAKK